MNVDPKPSNGSSSEAAAAPSREAGLDFAGSATAERTPPAGLPGIARRVRVSIEGTWSEAARLGEALVDPLVLPTSGFTVTAIAWATTLVFFVLSLFVGGILGVGALVLFVGLELLAALAYAYPGALFLLSLAGGIAPPLVLYWAIHAIAGVEGGWESWAFYPAILTGAWGSYYYWRFGRVIASTGEGVLSFYRNAAPKAAEIFGMPFLILSALWDGLKLVFGLFRAATRALLGLVTGRRGGSSGGAGDDGPAA